MIVLEPSLSDFKSVLQASSVHPLCVWLHTNKTYLDSYFSGASMKTKSIWRDRAKALKGRESLSEFCGFGVFKPSVRMLS